MTHYEILGLAPTATAAEIKAAYRRLAKGNHPDRVGGDGHDRMAAINAAYDCLSDPERRKRYDELGVDSQAPDVRQQAEARLMSTFNAYLSQEQEPDRDLVTVFREGVETHAGQTRAQLKLMERMVEKLQKRRDRLKGGTLFAQLADQKIVEYRQGAARAKDDLAIDEAALEILKAYSDTSPPQARVQTIYLGGGGAFSQMFGGGNTTGGFGT